MTIEQMANRPFSLLRSFSILSLATILVISVASAVLLSRFLRENLLQRDAVVTMEFVQSIAQAENTSAYFAENEYSKSSVPLEQFFNQIAHMPDVRRANVYAKDGTIIWSNQRELIGRKYGQNPELERALNDEVAIFKTGRIGQEVKAEHVLLPAELDEFVENYIPVHDSSSGEVVGVVEVYKVPRVLIETIRMGNQLVWITAAIGGVFLYAMLFWIVRRAGMVITRQQQALVKTEKLAAIGEMAAAVAHGLRNPLASIRSSAELTLEEANPSSQESLGDIIREVDRLERWIRELLTYDPGDKIDARLISLDQVIRTSLEDFREKILQADVRLQLDLSAPLPAVQGDPNLVVQAFNNLVVNALEAMPEGGDLRVEARREGTTIRIKVIDSGVGLAGKNLGEIFTPFVSYKSNGLGIGLHLSRRILERFGGSLDLIRNQDVGMTALLSLPVSR